MPNRKTKKKLKNVTFVPTSRLVEKCTRSSNCPQTPEKGQERPEKYIGWRCSTHGLKRRLFFDIVVRDFAFGNDRRDTNFTPSLCISLEGLGGLGTRFFKKRIITIMFAHGSLALRVASAKFSASNVTSKACCDGLWPGWNENGTLF